MKITKRSIKKIIAEEYDNAIAGLDDDMSISSHPPAGMTGVDVGDVVYLTHGAYIDAGLRKYGDDFPPVKVIEVGPHKDLIGIDHKEWGSDTTGMRYDDYDWAADVGEEMAFVGEYQPAPGLPRESLVFPLSAIDWEYTERGPKEEWRWKGGKEKGTYAGGGTLAKESRGAKLKVSRKQIRKIIKEEISKLPMMMPMDNLGGPDVAGFNVGASEDDAFERFEDGMLGRDLGYGDEGRMAKSDLYKIANYAQELHEMLRDDDDLPEWVESKITKAAEYMSAVNHYLKYKLHRMGH